MLCNDAVRAAATLQIKCGATFRALCTYLPPDGGLASLVGAEITSQVRNSGALVADLNCDLAADGMSFVLSADDTSDWPTTTLQWDIRIEVDGEVVYTETVALQVLYNVTAENAVPPRLRLVG
jgi:hypothetical protein